MSAPNVTDGLGSTTQLIDASGSVTDTYTYDVFGALRSTTGSTTNPFDFAAQQTDHTANRGLQYLRARHYDPALGRFLGRDAVPFAQRYAYAGNDPIDRMDSTGRADSEERHRPVAVPLPIPGTTEAHSRCDEGYQKCIDELAPAEQRLRRNDPYKYMRTPRPYNDVCRDFLTMCYGDADTNDSADFDFNGARERMRTMGHGRTFFLVPVVSDFLQSLPLLGQSSPCAG